MYMSNKCLLVLQQDHQAVTEGKARIKFHPLFHSYLYTIAIVAIILPPRQTQSGIVKDLGTPFPICQTTHNGEGRFKTKIQNAHDFIISAFYGCIMEERKELHEKSTDVMLMMV